jgi:hypothetical protein
LTSSAFVLTVTTLLEGLREMGVDHRRKLKPDGETSSALSRSTILTGPREPWKRAGSSGASLAYL